MMKKLFLIAPMILLLAACVAPQGQKIGSVNDDLTPDFSRSKPDVQKFMRMGQEAVDSNNASVAFMMYNAASQADPADPAPQLALAQLSEQAGDFITAARLYEALAKKLGGNTTVELAAARSYLKAKNYAEAATRYEGIANRTGDWRAYNGLGVLRDLEGNASIAMRAYQTALEKAPDDEKPKVRANLALSYILGEEPRKAIELLEPFDRARTLSTTEQRYLALAYGFVGRVEDAQRLGLKEPPSPELLRETLETVDGPGVTAAPTKAVSAAPID